MKVTNELRRNAQRAGRVYIPREFLSKPIWLSAMRCHTIDAVASKWHFAFVMRAFSVKICLTPLPPRRVLLLHPTPPPSVRFFSLPSSTFYFFPSPAVVSSFFIAAQRAVVSLPRVGANLIRNAN